MTDTQLYFYAFAALCFVSGFCWGYYGPWGDWDE